MKLGETLPAGFYQRDPIDVARDLIGMQLVRRSRGGITAGRIVEVEAYLAAGDTACHASRGPTPRNRVMFGRPGLLYVYAIHSRYCLNVVTEAAGRPSAVLIRAVEPTIGLQLMSRRRGTPHRFDLARGPGRLCQAFEVGRSLDGWDLTKGKRIWLSREADNERATIGVSQRIGVTSAKDLPLRFFVDGSRFVSGPRGFHSRKAPEPR